MYVPHKCGYTVFGYASDSFTFKVNDGTDDSTAATVSLAITGVNDVPVAVANTLTVAEDASITNTNVIANDTMQMAILFP